MSNSAAYLLISYFFFFFYFPHSDNFNVLDLNSKNNFYRSHSVQGKDHQRSYIYQVHGSQGEVYSFIGLDACIEPGPKRPFNFIGVLKQADIELLQQLKKKADVDEKHYTIWFGHYPTSCIISPSDFKVSIYRSMHVLHLITLSVVSVCAVSGLRYCLLVQRQYNEICSKQNQQV